MLRHNLLGYEADRCSEPAIWTLDELVRVVDHSFGGAIKPGLERTVEGLQMARIGSKPNFRFEVECSRSCQAL
jgi:hypothetical protein